MEGWTQYLQDFEWLKGNYENPKKMLADLKDMGFKVVDVYKRQLIDLVQMLTRTAQRPMMLVVPILKLYPVNVATVQESHLPVSYTHLSLDTRRRKDSL